jgi:hypothetical protein
MRRRPITQFKIFNLRPIQVGKAAKREAFTWSELSHFEIYDHTESIGFFRVGVFLTVLELILIYSPVVVLTHIS